ncbi:hypothetical protein BAL199_28555 [alpha proteobacterium BAL199]|nr:hypothetical protein BAL199_28555 [alpha proteobacterium BAL199]
MAPQKAGRDEGMVSPVEQRDRCRPVVRPQLDSRYPLGFQKRPSGMSLVPMLFNKRILYTNWMPFGDFLFSRKSMTITKTLYRNGDRIPFLTMNREFRGVYNRLLFDLNDVVVVDNSPEEILQAVQDMEKYPDGEIDYSNPLKVRIAPSFAKKMGIV